jgi:hypothetical protein
MHKLVRRRTILISAALFSILFQRFSAAQTAPHAKIDVSKLGPQVGERVPDFSLPDQNGKVWTLQSIMGPKGAMLVFIRSADW